MAVRHTTDPGFKCKYRLLEGQTAGNAGFIMHYRMVKVIFSHDACHSNCGSYSHDRSDTRHRQVFQLQRYSFCLVGGAVPGRGASAAPSSDAVQKGAGDTRARAAALSVLRCSADTFDPGHGVTNSWCFTRCSEHRTQCAPDVVRMLASINRVLQHCSGTRFVRHLWNKVTNAITRLFGNLRITTPKQR